MTNFSVVERRNKIIDILNKKGKVYVKDLSELFEISEVVIRTDLSELEKQGLLSRIHGGAITSYKPYYDMSLAQRSNTNHTEKQLIAKKICDIIMDNDTVIMNAGTTPLFVMRNLKDKRVTIVTNSIALALEGNKNSNLRIILLGGDVDSEYQFTYGVPVIKSLNQYNANLFIMSVDGIDVAKGITTFYHQESEICKSMMEHSLRTIIAADYSKIGRAAFTHICDLNEIDTIITAGKINPNEIKKIKAKNISVIKADK